MSGIGALNKRLELIEAVYSDDGAGGQVRNDTVVATVWADIRVASYRERFAGGRAEQVVSHIAKVRANPEITFKHGMRARWQDFAGKVHDYRIEAAQDMKLDARYLEVQLMEGGPL